MIVLPIRSLTSCKPLQIHGAMMPVPLQTLRHSSGSEVYLCPQLGGVASRLPRFAPRRSQRDQRLGGAADTRRNSRRVRHSSVEWFCVVVFGVCNRKPAAVAEALIKKMHTLFIFCPRIFWRGKAVI